MTGREESGAAPRGGQEMLARLSEGFCPRGHDRLTEHGTCGPCGQDVAHYVGGGDPPTVQWRMDEHGMVALTMLTTGRKCRYAWSAPWLVWMVDQAGQIVEAEFLLAAGRAAGTGW